MIKKKNISEVIKQKSKELGFLECGIVPAGILTEEEDHLKTWLDQGMYGKMDFMARNIEKRLDPAKLFEHAKSVIVVLQNYFTPALQTDPKAPVLSRYAYGRTYQNVIRIKLYRLLEFIRKEIPGCSGRTFVDSAPIIEKAWARRAGLGWIGKNSLLISKYHGSFHFIGEIILDTELQYDSTPDSPDYCKNCTRCMNACPTHAIVSPRVVDIRKCIAYQTIEIGEGPDENLRGMFRNRVFGCDICQEVCPWNRRAAEHEEEDFRPSPALMNLTAQEWEKMDESMFSKLFQNSAVQRAGFEKLKKNIDFLKKIPGV